MRTMDLVLICHVYPPEVAPVESQRGRGAAAAAATPDRGAVFCRYGRLTIDARRGGGLFGGMGLPPSATGPLGRERLDALGHSAAQAPSLRT